MRYVHGDSGTRLYRIWKSMKCRCLATNHPSYKNYGARGIEICPEWITDYPAFKAWALTHGYADTLELDRINVNGNYTPENCRWITHYEQTLNRRDTLYIIVNGQPERLRDFCEIHHINIHSVNDWRRLGIVEKKISERIGQKVIVRQKREVIGI